MKYDKGEVRDIQRGKCGGVRLRRFCKRLASRQLRQAGKMILKSLDKQQA